MLTSPPAPAGFAAVPPPEAAAPAAIALLMKTEIMSSSGQENKARYYGTGAGVFPSF
jgi:hypothetical protein